MTNVKKLAIIVAVMAVIWSLMSLPVIVYYLPQLPPDNDNNLGDGVSLEPLYANSTCNLDPVVNVTVPNGSTDSTNVSSPLMCSEGFVYIEEAHQCRPHCPSWEEFEHGFSIAYNVILATSVAVSVLASITVLVLSCLQYKRMFTFPSVFIVYQVISLLILESTFLIGFTDREALFCSSQVWLDILNIKTPFCIFSAVVFYYTIWQASLWWLFHISAVFCGIKFPVRTRSFKKSSREKYVHIGVVIAGILIPVVPVTIITSVSRFSTSFPPIYCYAVNETAVFYAMIFPCAVLGTSGVSMIAGMAWIVIKEYCCFRSKGIMKGQTKPIIKLLILFTYFSLLVVVALTGFAINLKAVPPYHEALLQYFCCKRNPDNMECPQRSYTTKPLSLVVYILLSIYPLTCLIYTVNTTELKEKFSAVCLKFKKLSKWSKIPLPNRSTTEQLQV